MALALWIAAVASPYAIAVYGYAPLPKTDVEASAWPLLAWGWLGPLAASVAWYANPLLIVMLVRLVRGRTSGPRLSLVALVLAGSALLPSFLYDFEQDGRYHRQVLSGPAIWLWIAAFVPPAVLAWLAPRLLSERRP